METLVEPAGQTLVEPADKEERSRDLGETEVNLASVEESVGKKKDDDPVFETEISADQSGMSWGGGKRGRKRRVSKLAGDQEKDDAERDSLAQESEKNASSVRKSGRRGGAKESVQGVPENAEVIDDESVQGDHEDDDEYEIDGQQCRYSVGDLVWGKIKSHPWWPGQVYRSSDASEAATKYKRRNRLLVAYFGDGTFAWCDPSQLKPFNEYFVLFANQSNLKSFTKAVEAAVKEIGRCIELEMTCCCVAGGDKPDKPVAVNAGIKEGVAVPDIRLEGLSISQCEPADFLAHLKYIAQVVSVNNMLDLLVLQHRLSIFYRAKGYRQLPVYHEPMDISVPDDTAVNESTPNDNVKVRTEDIARSRAMDDNPSFHTMKERSMTELMATETSVNDEVRGNLFAGEGTMLEKETVTTKNRRKSMRSEAKSDNILAEELNTPAKQTPASRTRKKNKDAAGLSNDGTEEIALPVKTTPTPTPRKRRKSKGSEVVKNDMADESTLIDVEVGNINEAAEEINVVHKQRRGRRARNKIQEADIGHEHDVAKEPTLSSQQTLDSSKMEKVKDFEVENEKGTVKEITLEGKRTTKVRKRKENIDSELGNNSGAAERHDAPSTMPKKTRQRAPKASAVENSDFGKDGTIEEGLTDGKLASPPEASRKTKRASPSVTGENKDSDVENDGGGKSGIVKEGTTDGESDLTTKTPKKGKPTGLSVTVEHKPFDVENEDLGSNERSKSGVSFRERKKSKYLSPPYTNISSSKGGLFSPRDSKSEKSILTSPREGNNVTGPTGHSNIWSPLVRCSGKTPQSNVSGTSSPLLDKAVLKERNVHEMLSDIRSATLDPSYLGKVQSDDLIKGFFTEFRGSVYHDEHEVMVQNKISVDPGGRRVSFETKADSPKDTHKTDFQMSEGESERKKSKKEEDEKMQSPKLKSKHAGVTSNVQMDSNGDANVEKPVPVLLLTFVPGVLLPSKDELIATFSPCGALKESETKIIEDSCSAQVVFAKEADALEAYNKFEDLTSFGSSVISYRLRYLLPASLASENAGSSHQHQPSVPSSVKGTDTAAVQSNSSQVVDGAPLASIKQNIEMANSMLEKSWDKLSPEVKTSLDDEIRSFLNKVTSMVGSSSS